jgi:hypothetical protein
MFCEFCSDLISSRYGSGRFCSSKSARGFSTKARRAEINSKVSKKLSNRPSGRTLDCVTISFLADKRREKLMELPWESIGLYAKKSRVLGEQNHRCNGCNLDEWRGQPLVLEIEHKDGNNQNNARENLEGLCPNCHSQTPTWRGRNKGRSKSISDQEFIEHLQAASSIHRALLSLGLSAKGTNYNRARTLIQSHGISM